MKPAVCLAVLLLATATATATAMAARAQTPASDAPTLARIDAPKGILRFSPRTRKGNTVRLQINNPRKTPVQTLITVRHVSWAGKELFGQGVTRTLAPGMTPVSFDLPINSQTPYGVYVMHIRLKPTGQPGSEAEYYYGVSDDLPMRKARPGEFLYGLDAQFGEPDDRSPSWAWMQFMGVDIVRNGFRWEADPSYIRKRIPFYQSKGLTNLAVLDPPKAKDPAEHQRKLDEICRNLERIARENPTQIHYELGNEPDLFGFYPLPIEQYAADFKAMAQAVKRGNPRAFVVNGGLSFAGNEGTERSRRLVEVMDTTDLDAWAYHGHGPGVKAERAAYERMARVRDEFKRGPKPLVQTESGVAARTKTQEWMQARTAIQKLVYGQSQHMPYFMWFRLLMFEEDYGNLQSRDGIAPRPAVLSYHTTAQNLRGYDFEGMVATGDADLEAYRFRERNNGRGRVLVAWTNRPVTRSVTLALAPTVVSGLALRDMMNNPLPSPLPLGGTVQLPVGEDPVFLKWQSAPNAVAKAAAPLVQTTPTANLVYGVSNPVAVTVRNPYPRRATFTLDARSANALTASVTPATRTVALAPNASRRLNFGVSVGNVTGGITWPRTWTVQVGGTAPADRGTIPRNGQVRPIVGSTLDFATAGQPFVERTPAYVFGEVISDANRTVTMGASADYWMEWQLNGKPVYSTLTTGNGGGYTITDHTFPITLKKGRNVLQAQVLSGSQGFKLLVGEPREIAALKNTNTQDRLTFTLRENGTVLSRELVEMQYTAPVPALGALAFDAPLSVWAAQPPTLTLSGDAITNLFVKEPDTSRWWKGDDDLSASAWVRSDARKLYLLVRVRDDKPFSGTEPGAMWQNDSLQIALSPNGREPFTEYTVGQIGGKTTAYRHASATGQRVGIVGEKEGITTAIERIEPGATVYRVTLDRGGLGTSFFLNLLINDNDGWGRKQWAEWKPGLGAEKLPDRWQRIVLKAE